MESARFKIISNKDDYSIFDNEQGIMAVTNIETHQTALIIKRKFDLLVHSAKEAESRKNMRNK